MKPTLTMNRRSDEMDMKLCEVGSMGRRYVRGMR